ncbi:MAG: photosynthetic reaction center subunit H [Gammaproteobacteria bacterium]|nr:photosynthetic reaction center subunit H [Gammaproteobacteria bacterium]
MTTGAFTGYIDVAQIVLYAFWIFFAGLILYLRREDKREGYPLESAGGGAGRYQGFPAMPPPKTFKLADGELVLAPRVEREPASIKATPTSVYRGSPLEPDGDPMHAGVGPGAHVDRSNRPDRMLDHRPLIVPMRAAAGFHVAAGDPDPRGMPVIGADGDQAGVVRELWVDRAEPQIRYLEVEISGGRHVLLPIHFANIDIGRGRVKVRSILSTQFAGVPATASADEVTLREEDAITAYYAGGTLYATPARSEPLI